uniref:Fe2OG dioxygenase domain-containing protein n=1 Tax=Chenopodium quinoa TaxID=63459 RepID=A0A803M232_CHEQI
MTKEQVKVFREPFNKKKEDNCMNLRLSPGSYRWGSPTPNCLTQLSWSEAFHIPMTDICNTGSTNIDNCNPQVSNLCDFLTILYQDQVGGLQLVKDGKWISVKPNPEALIVNIGDLFQAWSNGVYNSVVHRVVANPRLERFSTAYFLCPSGDAIIQSFKEPSIYRKFSFGEYRQQVQQDVKEYGYKIGLSRFLICN